MIETIEYKGSIYPKLQAEGNAMKFATPFFNTLINPDLIGYDIGCSKEEWKFNGAIPIDTTLGKWSAMNLPYGEVNYIVSSHMLEHYTGRLITLLKYWLIHIKKGGLICLYLPNCDYQRYWAFGNEKHIHYLSPIIMRGICSELGAANYMVTDGFDLNGSFYCIIEK